MNTATGFFFGFFSLSLFLFALVFLPCTYSVKEWTENLCYLKCLLILWIVTLHFHVLLISVFLIFQNVLSDKKATQSEEHTHNERQRCHRPICSHVLLWSLAGGLQVARTALSDSSATPGGKRASAEEGRFCLLHETHWTLTESWHLANHCCYTKWGKGFVHKSSQINRFALFKPVWFIQELTNFRRMQCFHTWGKLKWRVIVVNLCIDDVWTWFCYPALISYNFVSVPGACAVSGTQLSLQFFFFCSGGYFLACKDFGGSLDGSLPACAFYFFF